MNTLDLDDEIAHEICSRFEYSGKHFDEGSFVAIEGGRVLGVSGTFEDANETLRRSGVPAGEGMVCEVERPCRIMIR